MNNTPRNGAMGTCAGFGLLIPMVLALALCPWGCTAEYVAHHQAQQEKTPMQPAAHTIEELVEIIAATKPTAEDIAQALGPRIPDELSELRIAVKIDKFPFETALVSYPDPPLHTSIHIWLTLAPGEWYLRDLAAEPERWQTGTDHQPDGWTGCWRDWERPRMSISSSCELEGFDGPLPGRKIRYPAFVIDPL